MDEIAFDRGAITAIPFLGEHADLNVVSKAAYLLQVDSYKLLFAADFATWRLNCMSTFIERLGMSMRSL